MKSEFRFTESWLMRWQQTTESKALIDLLLELPAVSIRDGEIDATEALLDGFLKEFCSDLRGEPSDPILESVEKTDQGWVLSGSFQETWHYGCRDMDGSCGMGFAVSVSLDEKNGVLTLEVPDAEREPDE